MAHLRTDNSVEDLRLLRVGSRAFQDAQQNQCIDAEPAESGVKSIGSIFGDFLCAALVKINVNDGTFRLLSFGINTKALATRNLCQ